MGGGSSSVQIVSDSIDTLILETKDLNKLNELLEVKLKSFLHSVPCKKITFDPNFVIENIDKDVDIDIDNVDLACKILEKYLKVCEDFDKTFEIIIGGANKRCTNTNLKKPKNTIKYLKFLISYSSEPNKQNILFNKLEVGEAICFLTQKLLDADTKLLAYDTLVSYFGPLSHNYKLQCINGVYKIGSDCKNLEIFCAMLNHITSDDNFYNDKSLCFHDDNFWPYIESCISGPVVHLQKQGGHILLKHVERTDNKAFVSRQLSLAWKSFFILIDIGREKQLHLVAPTVDLLGQIGHLSSLWRKCVFKIYLRHPQPAIAHRAIIHSLSESFEDEDLKEIVRFIFEAINTNNQGELAGGAFMALRDFCHKLNENNLEMIVEELTKVKWNPVGFLKTIRNVLIGKLSVNLSSKLLCCAVNLPHVYFRSESLKYLLDVLWDERDAEKAFQIIRLLIETNETYVRYVENRKLPIDLSLLVIRKLKEPSLSASDALICLTMLKMDHKPFYDDVFRVVCNPNALLALYISHLLTAQSLNEAFQTEIEAFLLSYYNSHLQEETVESFLHLLELFYGELSSATRKNLMIKPLFESRDTMESQIMVALKLLAKSKNNMPSLIFKWEISGETSVNVHLSNKDSKRIICANNPFLCNECVNLNFALNEKAFSQEETETILRVFKILLQSHHNKIIFNIYGKFRNLITVSESLNLLFEFLPNFNRNLQEIDRDKDFKIIVQGFILMVYSPNLFQYSLDHINDVNDNLLNICQSYPIVKLKWIEALNKLCSTRPQYQNVCLTPILDLYLQDTVVTKVERNEFNLCLEFMDFHRDFSPEEDSNPIILNALTRLRVLETLGLVAEGNLMLVVDCLKVKYMKHFNKRYFPDSLMHYEKLRILQALLILIFQSKLEESEAQTINEFVFKCIQEETSQNCIKQIFNWILVLTEVLMLKNGSLVMQWIKSLPSNTSATVFVTLTPAIYHLSTMTDQEGLEELVKIVLPWSMGPQFKLRTYAQFLLRKLCQEANQKRYEDFLSKYGHLGECIDSIEATEAILFSNTLKTDLVFMNDLDPITDRTWLTVLKDIPRLNNVNPTEWQHLELTIENETKWNRKSETKFPQAVDEYLIQSKSKSNHIQEPDNVDILHLQKKSTPWKGVFDIENKDNQTKEFILIASLVEKPQNLGGLSRTCEAFGIRNIVFNDVKIIADKEFRSLSMSSESWINPIETKIDDLKDYIRKLRADGYSVIGAEQTAGSKPLNEYEFKRKTALILGNEKTGIPFDVIPLLDSCVEIPQSGQTRSLNAHVAGAMFIWEYAKQCRQGPPRRYYSLRSRGRSRFLRYN